MTSRLGGSNLYIKKNSLPIMFFNKTNHLDQISNVLQVLKSGALEGFQIAFDISGPLGDLAGRGAQRSGKVDTGGLTKRRLDWNR